MGLLIFEAMALVGFLAVCLGVWVFFCIQDRKEQRNLDMLLETQRKQKEMNEKLKYMGFHQ
jgi:uncharacterized protein HemX